MTTTTRFGRPLSTTGRGWMFLGLTLASALPMLAGCASANEDQLRARAAYDFNCPQQQISLMEIDDRTRGVEGCGQRAAYVATCDGPKNNALTRCTWVKDSPTTASAQPPAPPAPPPAQ